MGVCRFVDEYILPAKLLAGLKGKEVTPEDISTHNTTDVDLRPDDIIVHNMKINYGSKVCMGGGDVAPVAFLWRGGMAPVVQ